ncbi:MAG: TonB-dependent receptor domain-containing protein [Bryobacteraceae bacterium]
MPVWRPTARIRAAESLKALFLVFAFALLTPGFAGAQVLYGSIVGTVTDASGAVVPGAKVSITNEGTSKSRQAITNTGGAFSFPATEAGTYDVSVTQAGFAKFTQKGIKVAVDQVARVNAALQPGELTQTIEVTSQAAPLQTDSAQVRSEINTTSLENLPISIDSNYESLLVTVPGVSMPSNSGSYAANPARGLSFYTNGATENSNDIRIDGVSTNNLWLPFVAGYVPSREAIQAVSVVTNSSEVSQGIVGGGAVNVDIKSGTNQVHGSAYWYNMNNALEAAPFAFVPPPPGQNKPKLISNNIGGTIGGPILKNKLFYFGSYEGDFLRNYAQALETVPTVAMRTGDFSAASNPGATYTTIYNPLSGNTDGTGRTPFAGNSIPQNMISSTSAKVLSNLAPDPNQGGATNNYFADGDFKSDRDTVDTKLDWNTTDKLRTSVRLGWLHYSSLSPAVFGNNGPEVFHSAGRSGVGLGDVYNVTASEAYVARPNLVVNGYFGMILEGTNNSPFDLNVNEGLTTLGIPGTNGPTINYGGWPAFNVTDYALFGNSGGVGGPISYNDHTFIYSIAASWVKGSHTIGFGGSVTRQSFNHFEGSPAGTFNFGDGTTALNLGKGKSSKTGQMNSMAAFLLGLTSSVGKDIIPYDNDRMVAHMWQYSAYVQDRWQARSNLTLNGGLSWNYFPMGARNGRGLERYNFNTNQVEICGVAGNPSNCGYDIPWAEFSPSIGIAYRPTNTLVLRAGGGITYDPEPLAFVRDLLADYPEDDSLTLNSPNSFSYASVLAAGIPPISVPDLSSGSIPLPPGFSGRSLTQKVKRDYMESWNFTVQKQLRAGWVAQVGYVATRQVAIPGLLNLNVGQVGGGTASELYFQRFGNSASQYLETPVNHTHYDSLQAELSHTFAKNYQFHAAYTWSKVIGYCCNNLADGGPSIQLPQYFNLNRALEPWDTPQALTISWVASSPFGRGQRWLDSGSVASKLAGGWQLSLLFTAHSGSPFTVSSSGTSLDAPGNSQQADLIGSGPVAIYGKAGPGQLYFDTSRFAPVTAVRFGTSGFDNLFGPGLMNIDLGLFRNFKLTERWTLQFRANAFNLTNTPSFDTPNSTVDSSSFGQISGLSSIGGTEGINQRIFQLGMHLSF